MLSDRAIRRMRPITARLEARARNRRVRRLRRRLLVLAAWHGATVEVDIAPDAVVSPDISLEIWSGTWNRVVIGSGVRISDGVRFSLRGGSISVGAKTELRRNATYQVSGELQIGSGVVLNPGIQVHCAERVAIGDLTIIGEYSTIADSRHLRTAPDVPVHHSVVTAPISIGRNIWMGAHVVIASGVTVGDLAFVAAGAVVTKDVEPSWLVGGVPARPLRRLETEA